MSRSLTQREREVLEAMVRHGIDDDAAETDTESLPRQAWLAQVPTARTPRGCGCGTCPSIELVDASGTPAPEDPQHRVVLWARVPGALVLLFIDDGRLSYLELAPVGQGVFPEFPPAELLTFDA